jgi:hypothetical protein
VFYFFNPVYILGFSMYLSDSGLLRHLPPL